MSSKAIIHERYNEAVNGDTPLAEHGVNLFESGTHHLVDSLRIDHDSICDFLEAQGMDREHFQQPFIQITESTPAGPGNRKFGKDVASMAIQHVIFRERAYFPYIQLSVDPAQPDISALNKNLRHELGHFKNGDAKIPFYERPGSDNLVRLMGMSVLMNNYVAFPPTPIYPTSIELIAHGLTSAAGAFAIIVPHAFSHGLEPIEMRANRFARKHKAFRPVSLVEE